MIRLKGFVAASCLFALLVLSPAVASADNLVVTGGTVVATGTFGMTQDSVTLIGTNFSTIGSGVTFLDNTACQPCSSGHAVDFGNHFPGGLFHDSTDGVDYNTFTLGGSTYTFPDFHNFVNFVISAPATFVVPDGNPATFSLSVPFTMSGTYFVVSSTISGSQVIGSGTVTGQGIADIVLVRDIDPLPDGTFLYQTHSATYRFTASAVPEPTTLALLSAGTAGLYLRLRKKRRG